MEHLHQANKLDQRPLKPLVQAVEAIVALPEAGHGLLLWERGGSLDHLQGGGGGTKRLETLSHQQQWKAPQSEDCLWWRAEHQLQEWDLPGEEGVLIWDGTILEKPESLKGEGWCPVRSSQAGRLTPLQKGSAACLGGKIVSSCLACSPSPMALSGT